VIPSNLADQRATAILPSSSKESQRHSARKERQSGHSPTEKGPETRELGGRGEGRDVMLSVLCPGGSSAAGVSYDPEG
jgi:hypothetical protein